MQGRAVDTVYFLYDCHWSYYPGQLCCYTGCDMQVSSGGISLICAQECDSVLKGFQLNNFMDLSTSCNCPERKSMNAHQSCMCFMI